MLKSSWALRIAIVALPLAVAAGCQSAAEQEQAAAAIAGAEAMAAEAMQTANNAMVAVDELRAAPDFDG